MSLKYPVPEFKLATYFSDIAGKIRLSQIIFLNVLNFTKKIWYLNTEF